MIARPTFARLGTVAYPKGVMKPWKKSGRNQASATGAQPDEAGTAVPASKLSAQSNTPSAGPEFAETSASVNEDADAPASTSKAFTPKKGRPTPKRNEVERQHGVRRAPVDAPATAKEARARRKELKNSMSKEDYKAYKQRKRDEEARARRQANERMMAGDENYLMERDRGPEKRLVRDWVDAHRYIMNLFLPMTFVVIIVMLIGMRNPAMANLSSFIMMGVFVIMIAEGVWLGRKINRLVNERFPKNPHSGFSLGMYAFTRATMIRKMRTPAPQKRPGDNV